LWHSDIGVGHAEQQLAIKGKERKILKSVTINWHLGQMQYVPAVPDQKAKWPQQHLRKENHQATTVAPPSATRTEQWRQQEKEK